MSHEHHLGCACCTLPHLPELAAGPLTEAATPEQLEAAIEQAYGSHAPAQAPQAAIFHGGVIHTLAAEGNRQVEALGMADGVIVAVGALQHVRQAMQAHRPREIDLAGRTLLPGLIDAHMHILPSALYQAPDWLPLSPFLPPPRQQELNPEYSSQTIKQAILDALKQHESLPEHQRSHRWVLGFGVDPSLMAKWEDITADTLDALSDTVPILLMNASGHIAYVNGAAMRKADIRDNSEGVLTEMGIAKVLKVVPPPSLPLFLSNLKQVLQNASQMGITTLFDAGLGATPWPDLEIGLIKSAARRGPVRIAAALFTPPEEAKLDHWLRHQRPDLDNARNPRFAIKAIKLIADGSNQGLTGYQTQPYACADEHSIPDVPDTGLSNYPDTGLFNRMLEKAVDQGWPVLVHANGDKAMEYVLGGYRQVLTPQHGKPAEQVEQRRKLRLRVEHASLLNDAAIDEMAALRLNPSFLIGHVGYWGYSFKHTILDSERAQLLDRCKSAVDKGIRISLHSDHFVSPLGPLRMMEQAAFRIMEGAPEGEKVPLNPEERLSREQALRAVTLDAAWQCHMDHMVGSLEPGKQADLVILERDPLNDAVTDLRGITVHETWSAGAPAYLNRDTH
ncbi:amidohydrolase [Chromobacterium sp. ATCC 53434]|uniref:amidohydrolase n=1 Tax=Chromobacterium sp. (strain ATCC 53434 / SC 14030) TaxID=2059672 RepID=UPI000C77B90D|nr:amidohydrolase [Chromobacterium sp. ATCC 53434]AUH50824.1 amidohydrolase [Chromobacterium sp. ATCC 53434]